MGEDLLLSREGIGVVGGASEPVDFFQVGSDDAEKMRIYLRYQLFRNLEDFALRNTSQEQAGLLLGSHTKENTWIKIEEAVEVKPNRGSFPESVWRDAFAQASRRYPGMSVVGWFHSHPGSGTSLTPKEEEIHRKFFPKQTQAVYIIDPVVRERNFHVWEEGKLKGASGFRIFGKTETPAGIMGREPVHSDDVMNERYLERSVEKLQRMLRNPVVRPIDYVIVVLAALNLAVMLLRPAPAVKVDQRDVLANQTQISSQIETLNKEVKSIEDHLEAVGVLDKELGLPAVSSGASVRPSAPSDEKTAVQDKNTAKADSQDTPKASVSGDKILIHTVKSGETISSIAEKYYSTTSPKVCKALGKFNKLAAPRYEHIVPGDKLKIPARDKVGL